MSATVINLPSLEFGEYWRGSKVVTFPAGFDYSTFTHGKLQIRDTESTSGNLLLTASTTAGSGNGYLTLNLVGQVLTVSWAVPTSVTTLLNTSAANLSSGYYEIEISDGSNVIPLFRGSVPFVIPIAN